MQGYYIKLALKFNTNLIQGIVVSFVINFNYQWGKIILKTPAPHSFPNFQSAHIHRLKSRNDTTAVIPQIFKPVSH
jgi:hypothetical protein